MKTKLICNAFSDFEAQRTFHLTASPGLEGQDFSPRQVDITVPLALSNDGEAIGIGDVLIVELTKTSAATPVVEVAPAEPTPEPTRRKGKANA